MKISYGQYNQRNKRTLKWVLYSSLFVLFIVLIGVIILYIQVEKHKTRGFSDAKQTVLAETDVTQIDKIERFHGNTAYHVVYGETEDGDKQVVFVPFKNNDEAQEEIENNEANEDQDKEQNEDSQDISTIAESDMITQKAVEEKWFEQCQDCQLIKTVPGVFEDELVWELTYVDSKDRYVFEYVSINDGEPYESLRFKPLFK